MSNTFVRRAGFVCLALVAVVLSLVLVKHVSASPSAVLDACINPGNGMMRLVDANTACHANETRVEWNVTGPQGPPGASAGGPPFVWVCTPASFPNAAGNPTANVYVFNGGSTTANVAVNILDKNGNNLAGVTIPGTNPPVNYPGNTGTNTSPLAAAATRVDSWLSPQTGPAIQGFDGVTNVSFSVRVTSDQPIVVGGDMPFGGLAVTPCGLLPK